MINLQSGMPTTLPWLFCTCSKTSNLFHNHDIRSRYAPIRSSYDELMIIMLCGHCHTIWPKSKVVTRMWTGIMGAKNINKTYKVFDCHLVSIPIAIFRSNSKCDQHLQCFGLGYTPPIIMKFCTRHNSYHGYTLVMCAKFHCDRLNIF